MNNRLLEEIASYCRSLEARIAHLEALEQSGAGAWELISETVLSAQAASVTFSSIPATYRALAMMVQVRSDYAAEMDATALRFNGDTENNYDWLRLYVDGFGTHSQWPARASSYMRILYHEGDNARANSFTHAYLHVIGYALTDREKYVFPTGAGTFGNLGSNDDIRIAQLRGKWRSTAAVSTILLYPIGGSNFVSGCRFALYGIT